ncbi:MAG: AI-2E family transporter [Bacillota bacterium]|nr:AI-2E family transporter [Bacillota bacterium]
MKKLESFKPKQTEHDKLLYKIALYLFLILALLILFEKVIGHLPSISSSISYGIHYLNRLTMPFIMGFAIAYVMNPFLNFFERRLMKLSKFFQSRRSMTRILCILINYIIVIGGTVWIVIYLLPEIRDSIMAFATNISVYSTDLNSRIRHIFDQIPFIDSSDVNSVINRILEPLQHASQNAPQILETLAANVYSFGRITLNFIMAIFIAFYMLYDKERFGRKAKKAIYAFFDEAKSERILKNTNRVHHIFNDFIVGKALDSLIIGILAFIGMTFLKAPFPLILALIIGVTNMIPYFGPFIGAIPAILITLLINPPLAIAVGIFVLILQQFDGNFLGPKILGDSVDLSPLWIILAVMIGGAVMGPVGMFIGVPIFATVKVFGGEYIDRLYRKKYPVSDPLQLSEKDDL